MISNEDAARALERVAELLLDQGASPCRAGAWRHAALGLRALGRPAATVLAESGLEVLQADVGVGATLAAALQELLGTGQLRVLHRLEGRVSPEDLFLTVPGMGTALAHCLHQKLGVETLEELEQAATDGRLAKVPGFGPRRVSRMRQSVTGLLDAAGRRRGRVAEGHSSPGQADLAPPLPLLLEVDRAYRLAADEGSLELITPRRFNPHRQAWLPVLHREQEGWQFTALFANTRRAHALGRTRDWVVIYFELAGDDGQRTVVSEPDGRGGVRRVVRGSEAECRLHHGPAATPTPTGPPQGNPVVRSAG